MLEWNEQTAHARWRHGITSIRTPADAGVKQMGVNDSFYTDNALQFEPQMLE
jgi:hypothetical protein